MKASFICPIEYNRVSVEPFQNPYSFYVAEHLSKLKMTTLFHQLKKDVFIENPMLGRFCLEALNVCNDREGKI
ncbi:hypothetical protein KU73_07360 [Pectobacterium wasabiae]|uniref:Uncharacterized protein n=1 Tax=Pectobacterium wasabiae TaxID=55208 RepID=A0AAW3EQH3_9GAMM|nr:hypothetical protein A7983_15915 [Pectobacterium wasabiae CFBP 3304]EJS93961.1 Hypothetical protein Y17_2938 [Pectobacterium wasabiae CFBP 3304]KFX10025.1 hypothetical protein JV38_03635 [Pectobacterium wasabiae]KGA30227.1 hypothetical protein KU73_07360 [Pectobacterium wasabiae]